MIPTNARAVALGSAPQNPVANPAALPPGALSQAVAAKQQIARNLMRQTPAFFGVGVGQSLDNPKEAAMVIYVDRKNIPGRLPATIAGLRTRYVFMDRLHVTRSYAAPFPSTLHCMPDPPAPNSSSFDPLSLTRPTAIDLN